MRTREEAVAIFNKFNIQTVEVEPTVYRVINNTQEFNINAIKSELNEGLLLVSPQTRYEKVPEGYNIEHGQIYYILLDYDNDELLWKYDDISRKTRRTVVSSFRYKSDYPETIDTIYSAEELGMT